MNMDKYTHPNSWLWKLERKGIDGKKEDMDSMGLKASKTRKGNHLIR